MKKLISKLSFIKPYLTKELLYMTIAVLAIIIYKFLSFDENAHIFLLKNILGVTPATPGESDYWRYMMWFISSFAYLFLIPFIGGLIIEGKNVFKKFGLKFNKPKIGIPLLLGAFVLMAVVITIAVKLFPDFKQYYPFAKYAATNLRVFVIFELAYFSYFIGWEFFYHSFLVFPYEEKFGKPGAILIGLLPFVLMHYGKPLPEVAGSLIAGIFLSVLSLETRTFWYGMLLHGMVAIFMDIAVVYF